MRKPGIGGAEDEAGMSAKYITIRNAGYPARTTHQRCSSCSRYREEVVVVVEEESTLLAVEEAVEPELLQLGPNS